MGRGEEPHAGRRGRPPESLLDAALAAARRLAGVSPEVLVYTKRQLQGPARLRLDAVTGFLDSLKQ